MEENCSVTPSDRKIDGSCAFVSRGNPQLRDPRTGDRLNPATNGGRLPGSLYDIIVFSSSSVKL